MAMACLLAPYDTYLIRQTATIEGDTDRDVQPGFFKGMITLGMNLLKMGKTAKVSLYISEIRPSDNMERSKYNEICSTSDLTRNVKSCQRN